MDDKTTEILWVIGTTRILEWWLYRYLELFVHLLTWYQNEDIGDGQTTQVVVCSRLHVPVPDDHNGGTHIAHYPGHKDEAVDGQQTHHGQHVLPPGPHLTEEVLLVRHIVQHGSPTGGAGVRHWPVEVLGR